MPAVDADGRMSLDSVFQYAPQPLEHTNKYQIMAHEDNMSGDPKERRRQAIREVVAKLSLEGKEGYIHFPLWPVEVSERKTLNGRVYRLSVVVHFELDASERDRAARGAFDEPDTVSAAPTGEPAGEPVGEPAGVMPQGLSQMPAAAAVGSSETGPAAGDYDGQVVEFDMDSGGETESGSDGDNATGWFWSSWGGVNPAEAVASARTLPTWMTGTWR